MAVDHTQMALGKRTATVDARTLKLGDYLDLAALPPIPETFDYSTAIDPWAMFLNDHLGCCVMAAMGHQEQGCGAMAGHEPSIVDADVLAAYQQIGGYVPGDPSTDRGADPLIACRVWKATGIAGQKIGVYLSVDPTNEPLVHAAAYLFGGLFCGLNLPLSAQNQRPWDVVPEDGSGRSRSGSWGGHMVYLCARTQDGQYPVITWGEVQPMTFRFLATYSLPSDLFVVLPDDWFTAGGTTPAGFNRDALMRDLAIITGQPDPGPAPTPTPTPTPPPAPTPPTPPPFTPDANVVRWTTWQTNVAALIGREYAKGDLASASRYQTSLMRYGPQIAAYFVAHTKLLEEPPAVPAAEG